MKRNPRAVFLAAVLALAASGCNLNLQEPSLPSPGGGEESLATAVFKTQSAADTATQLALDALPPSATPTQAPPTFTPAPTLTQTRGKVTVSVSKNTNCRAGPDKQFDPVGIMKVGETAEAIGRSADSTYWVIHLPSAPAKTCWLWYQWAAVTGSGESLPILESPPTPTYYPRPDLSLTYAGLGNCISEYSISVQIENTGNVALESVRMIVEDITEGTTLTHESSVFIYYVGCGTGGVVESVAPGAMATVSNANPGQFSYNPAGHHLHIIVSVCTENGLAGICQQSDFYVTVT